MQEGAHRVWHSKDASVEVESKVGPMATVFTQGQRAHVDYKHEDSENDQCLAFMPMSRAGAFLQVWIKGREREHENGTILYIPFGTLLVVPKYCVHSGGYAFDADFGGLLSDSPDKCFNWRLHFYLAKKEARVDRPTNTYVLPGPNKIKLELYKRDAISYDHFIASGLFIGEAPPKQTHKQEVSASDESLPAPRRRSFRRKKNHNSCH